MEKRKKEAFEWVMSFSNKADIQVLSENQYEYYKDQIKAKNMDRIFFDTFEINPVYVVSCEKRRSKYLRHKYPCHKCMTNGIILGPKNADGMFPICPVCEGTGIDLNTKNINLPYQDED